jgi:O-antigen/teichoic acid export membrane protein
MAIVHLFGTFWVRPSLVHVDREGVMPVLRFVAPMVMQTAFFMIWFNADIVALRVFGNLTTVGTYGATKSLSNAAVMIPSAIATALLPHAARVAATEVRTYFRNLLVPVCAASIVPLAALAVMGPWILSHVFGPGYESAAPALVILSAVMTMYGISLTMEASWIAMDRPNLVLVATAASAAVTVVVLVPLVLSLGMAGAAAALAAGVAVKLAILALASLGKGASRSLPHEVAA